MSQSFTFIDVAGNQAQYTVYEMDYRNVFRWSTYHGDQGFALIRGGPVSGKDRLEGQHGGEPTVQQTALAPPQLRGAPLNRPPLNAICWVSLHPDKMEIPVYLLFFLSGSPALIYQIVWQRTLFAIYGVNVESVTIVVSAFMLGLGLGSFAGRRIGRYPNAPRLLLFGAVLHAVALSSFGCSCPR